MAERLGRRHAVAVSSGTAALGLALRALNVEGGQVMLPSYVCTALLHATRQAGAEAVLVDVDPADGNLRADTVVAPQSGAVIVPHLFGQPAPVGDIARTSVPVIEDLAMALGTDGAGSRGLAAVCSFYATKVITSAGEGGMVLTDDADFADEIRSLREYDGQDPAVLRWNAKLTDVAAAVGRVQLRRLDEFVDRRRQLARTYRSRLSSSDLLLPPERAAANDYRFVVRMPKEGDLDAVIGRMQAAGVTCHRPIDQPLHQWLNKDPDRYPVSTLLWETSMSIPIYPTLTGAQQEQVCEAVLTATRTGGVA